MWVTLEGGLITSTKLCFINLYYPRELAGDDDNDEFGEDRLGNNLKPTIKKTLRTFQEPSWTNCQLRVNFRVGVSSITETKKLRIFIERVIAWLLLARLEGLDILTAAPGLTLKHPHARLNPSWKHG